MPALWKEPLGNIIRKHHHHRPQCRINHRGGAALAQICLEQDASWGDWCSILGAVNQLAPEHDLFYHGSHDGKGEMMTKIEIELADATAQAAQEAGLLAPQALARLFDSALRRQFANGR